MLYSYNSFLSYLLLSNVLYHGNADLIKYNNIYPILSRSSL